MRTLLGVGILFLLPGITFAAGFAKQSLFLSQATVEQNETVFVYAVVTNDTVSYFNGKLVVSDQEGPIGTTTVSLDTGHANTVSVSWTPKTVGSHRIIANLVNADDEVVEHEDYVFFVNKPAPPSVHVDDPKKPTKRSQSTTTVVDSSLPIEKPLENTLSKMSPSAAAHTESTFLSIDEARHQAVTRLDQGTEWSKREIAKSTKSPGGFMNTLWLMLATLALYGSTALSYVIANIGIFYPVLFAIFVFVLWRIFKLFKR